MSTYLFVTRPERDPESIGDVPDWWSCAQTTRAGDTAFVYVTGQGIAFEWSVVSDARPNPEFRHVCDVVRARVVAPPISIAVLKERFPREAWPAPHGNFQGHQAFLVPDVVAHQLRALIGGGGAEADPPSSLPEEIREPSRYPEGATKQISVNAYERNDDARRECIRLFGSTCTVCGFDFGAVYGPRGEGFIHVHHVVPLAEIRGEYEVDPASDLVPVCPNCHAMLHKSRDVLTVDELRVLLHQES